MWCVGQNMLLTFSDSSVFLVFELYYSLTSSKQGYTYDIYTEKVEQKGAVGITHGLAAVDKNLVAKGDREQFFPIKLADLGVSFRCVDGEASVPADKERILGEIGADVQLLDELVHAVVAQAALERVLKEGGDRQARYLKAIRRGKQLRLDLVGSLADTQEVLSIVVDELAKTGACQRLCLRTEISFFPDSISQLNALQELDLTGCSGLTALPGSISQLNALLILCLASCTGLKVLPDNIFRLSSLQKLDLTGCSGFTALPGSIGQLNALLILCLASCTGLKLLPDSICQLNALHELDLTGCSGLTTLPDSIGQLNARQELDSPVQELDSTIQDLEEFELGWFGNSRCGWFEAKKRDLIDGTGQPASLHKLQLDGCSGLRTLPDSIGQLVAVDWAAKMEANDPDAHMLAVGAMSRLPKEVQLQLVPKLEATLVDWHSDVRRAAVEVISKLPEGVQVQLVPMLEACWWTGTVVSVVELHVVELQWRP